MGYHAARCDLGPRPLRGAISVAFFFTQYALDRRGAGTLLRWCPVPGLSGRGTMARARDARLRGAELRSAVLGRSALRAVHLLSPLHRRDVPAVSAPRAAP